MGKESDQSKDAKKFIGAALGNLEQGQETQNTATGGGSDNPLNDQLLALAQMALSGTLGGTLGFTPELANRLGETRASTVNQSFDNNLDSIASRFSGTGSGTRGGAFADAAVGNEGDRSAALGEAIIGPQIQAALAQLPQIMAASQLGQGTLDFQTQFDKLMAQVNSGGANTIGSIPDAQSPFQSIGGLFGSILPGLVFPSLLGGGGDTPNSGNTTSLSPFFGSDSRLKRNIKTIGRLPNGIRLVSFTWRGTGEHDSGVIADEVAEVRPDLVMRGDDGYLRVRYGGLLEEL